MRILLFICLFISACTTVNRQDELFTYDGKTYARDDLPLDVQHKIFNAQSEYHQQVAELVRQGIVDRYLAEKANAQGISVAQMRAKYFPEKKATEAERKKFYEENRDKMPFSYDVVKTELESLMKEKLVKDQTLALLKEIEREKSARLLFEPPTVIQSKIMTAGFPRKGNEAAKIKVVEYGDFACPYCRAATSKVAALMKKHGTKIEFVFKYYLSHGEGASENLAKGGYCAFEQGKFWEYHDHVFDQQMQVLWLEPTEFVEKIGIDSAKFRACYNSSRAKMAVLISHDAGRDDGVVQTPTFFVNGTKVVAGAEGLMHAVEKSL